MFTVAQEPFLKLQLNHQHLPCVKNPADRTLDRKYTIQSLQQQSYSVANLTIFPWLIKSHVKAGNTSGHAGRGGDGFQKKICLGKVTKVSAQAQDDF